MIVMLSSIGLPFTNGFVGEFLILLGTFKSNAVYAIIAASGVILAACYMLWMYQRVIFGKVTNPENQKLTDLTPREKLILVPLVILIFWIGIYPKPFFERIEPAVRDVLARIDTAEMRAESHNAESDQVPFRVDDSKVVDATYSGEGATE
jgi:NADH-quinone oxidoreductase subunit M